MSSRLWTDGSSTWFGGKLDSVTGEPDSWKGLQGSRPISKDKTVGAILGVIRDALAHGNVWTRGDRIKEIIFVKSVTDSCEIVSKFSFVSVAPDEFRNLVENWFDFLIELHIPQNVAFEALKDAA